MVFDIAVLGVLLISAAFSFFRGFIREVLTILGVVGGLAAAHFGGPHLVPLMKAWLGVEEGAEPQALFGVVPYTILADALAYGSVFLAVVIVLSVISHFLAGWAKAIGLGAVDRSLGVIFGVARGVVVLAVLYLPVYLLIEKEARDEWVKSSRSMFYVETTSAWLAGLLPDSVRDEIKVPDAQTAESMAKATREKLEDLDLLQGDKPQEETVDPVPEATSLDDQPQATDISPMPSGGADGYNPEQRQNMEELIRDEGTLNE